MKMFKTAAAVLVSLIAACTLTVACSDKQRAEVTLDQTAVTVTVGGTVKLTAAKTGTDDPIVWESADQTIASVSDGVVTGKKAGSVVVTASAGGAKAECAVTVKEAPRLTLNRTETQLDVGKSETLTARLTALTGTPVWTTSDPAVATVSDGLVTAVGEGTATVTCTLGDRAETCAVRVVDRTNYIAISNLNEFLEIGDNLSANYYLTEDIDLEGSALGCFGWDGPTKTTPFEGILDGNGYTVTNGRISTGEYNYGLFREIGPNGVIRNIGFTRLEIAAGSHFGLFGDVNRGLIENVYADVKLSLTDQWGSRMGGLIANNGGKIRNCAVRIAPTVATLAGDAKRYFGAIAGLNDGSVENCYAVNAGSDERFDLAVGHNTGAVENVSVIEDLGLGTYDGWGMWVATADGPALNEIVKPDASVWLNTYSVSLEDGAGEEANLIALGYDADNAGSVAYRVGDDAIVSLEAAAKGRVVKAKKVGETEITVTYTAGAVSVTAVCRVKVTEARDVVTVGEGLEYVELDPAGTKALTAAAVNKGEPVERSFTWKSSDESVATVNESGVVTAVKAGVAKITASTEKSKVSGESVVAVRGRFINEGFTGSELPKGYALNTKTWPNWGKAEPSADGLVFDANAYFGTPILFLPADTVKGVDNYFIDLTYTRFEAFKTDTQEPYKDAAIAVQFNHNYDADYRVVAGVRASGQPYVDKGKKQNAAESGHVFENVGKLTSEATYHLRVAVLGQKATFYFSKDGGDLTPFIDEESGKVWSFDLEDGYPVRSIALELVSAKCLVKNVSVSIGEPEPYAIVTDKTLDLTTTLYKPLTAYFVYDAAPTWRSSDPAVATVDENGVVTGVKAGAASISASYTYKGETYTASCAVTVRDDLVPSIDGPETIYAAVGAQTTLTGTVTLAGEESDEPIVWTSEDPAVATVDDKGKVTAVKAGATRIAARAGESEVTDSIAVVVTGAVVDEDFAGLKELPAGWTITKNWTGKGTVSFNEGLYFDAEQFGALPVLHIGGTEALGLSDRYYADVTFTGFTTYKNGETVDLNRYIGVRFATRNAARYHVFAMTLGAKGGNEKVFAQTKEWEHGSDAIKTYYDPYTENIDEKATYTIRVAIADGNAYFYIKKGDGAFAPVTKDGKVVPFPLEAGYATDIAIDNSSAKFTVKKATVVLGEQPLAATLPAAAELGTTGTTTLAPSFTYGDLTPAFTSSDTAVATVSDKGVVTGLKAGKATITATYTYKGKPYAASCVVTVVDKPIVALETDYAEIEAGKTTEIKASVTLSGAAKPDAKIRYTSLDPAIATVDASGTVTGVKAGVAKIRVETENGIRALEATVAVKGEMDTDMTGLNELPEGWTFKHNESGKDGTIAVKDGKITMKSSAYYNTVLLTYDDMEKLAGAKHYTIDMQYTGFEVLNNDGSRYAVIRFMENEANLAQSPRFGVRQNGQVHYWGPAGNKEYPKLSAALDKASVYNMRVEVRDGYAYFYFWKEGETMRLMRFADGGAAVKIPDTCVTPYLAVELSSAYVTINSLSVTVGKSPDHVELSPETAEVAVGKTVTLTAAANSPDGAVFASSDPAIATVSDKGVVTGVKPGTVNVTATSGQTVRTCVVTVTLAPVLSVAGTYVELEQGKTFALDGKVTIGGQPDAAKTVTYTSSDSAIAAVAADGVITLKGNGIAYVTASAEGCDPIVVTVAARLKPGVVYDESFAGLSARPDDWVYTDPWGKAADADCVKTNANGIYVDSLKHGGNAYFFGAPIGVADNYTVDMTLRDWTCYSNNDTSRYLGVKFAFGLEDGIKNSYQVGMRKTGGEFFYTSYKDGTRKDEKSKGTTAETKVFGDAEQFVVRAAVTKKDAQTSEVRFYIGRAVDGQIVYAPVSFGGAEAVTFATEQCKIVRFGLEANSSMLTVARVTVTVNESAA